jgi:gluconate 2-dehydrogenase gamma chain
MFPSPEMDRRSLVGTIAALIGASTLPAEAFAAPAKSRGRRAAAARYLPPPRFATLSAYADTMIPVTDTPGAVAAGVPQRIDGLLRNWASAERRTQLVGALANIEARAQASSGKPFAALTPEARKALLVAHEAEAMKQVPRKDKLVGLAAMMGGASYADPGYGRLKDLVVSLYYMSEIGLTKELVYEHVPGTWVPSLKITPATRPFAGGGLFG